MEESELPWRSQARLMSGDLEALREGLTDILSNGPLNLDTPTPKRSPPQSRTTKDRLLELAIAALRESALRDRPDRAVAETTPSQSSRAGIAWQKTPRPRVRREEAWRAVENRVQSALAPIPRVVASASEASPGTGVD